MIKFNSTFINNLKISKKKFTILIVITLLAITSSAIYLLDNVRKCRNCIYDYDGITITKKEYDEALKVRQTFYQYSNQKIETTITETDVKNQIIEEKRLLKLADENNIKVTSEEAEIIYQERVRQNGSEEELLEKIKNMYGFDKSAYLSTIRKELLIEKVLSQQK